MHTHARARAMVSGPYESCALFEDHLLGYPSLFVQKFLLGQGRVFSRYVCVCVCVCVGLALGLQLGLGAGAGAG